MDVKSAMRSAVAPLVLAASLVACGGYPPAGPVPPRPASAAGAAGATPESVAAGHDLFAASCNKCHEYPEVTSRSEAEWPSIVKRMGDKAELDAKQTETVLHFVLAARAEKLSGGAK
jgi:cytochrome c5